MPSPEELLALFGDDFDDVLKGLAQLPPEARELLDGTMNKMLYDADIFDSRVSKAVRTQGASGMSAAAISAGLANDMATGGPVFGEIRNTIKGSLVEGISQTGRAGSFEAYDADDKTMFMWVTVAGHKVCLDCAPRGGQEKTLKEWEQEGMPGSGWSVCKGYCYCILDPSGKISPRLQMEARDAKKIQEKGATIRPKTGAKTATTTKAVIDKKFTSQNAQGNQHFVDAFTDSSEKFKSILMKFPELRHIAQQKRGGYFTEWQNKAFTKYYKGAKDKAYHNRHGAISIKMQSKSNMKGYLQEYSTIRHEYGHFMHHNLHPYIQKMDGIYKKYHDEIKRGISVSVDDFIKKHKLNKYASDHLKFHDAFVKARTRVGVGSKWKRTNKVMKESLKQHREMMNELHAVIWRGEKGGKYFTKDHSLVKALMADKSDSYGYIQDLFGALTKNKVGWGHADSYYNHGGMAMHETFANLTCIYSNENPILWNWLKENLPELTAYYDELMDTIMRDGYFGKSMGTGIESFSPPII